MTTKSLERLACFNAEEANATAASTSAAPEAAASVPCETMVLASVQDIIRPSSDVLQVGPPSSDVCDALKDIKVAPPMKKCGRPKGSGLTVIGLPTKRKRTAGCGPFRSRTCYEKKSALLTWRVGRKAAIRALNGNVLDEEDVETKVELLHCGILDECVDVNIVRTFFTSDAWLAVMSTVNTKRSVHQWECEECHSDLEECDSILCDWCLCWYHIPCTSLKRQPKKKLWQCSHCV